MNPRHGEVWLVDMGRSELKVLPLFFNPHSQRRSMFPNFSLDAIAKLFSVINPDLFRRHLRRLHPLVRVTQNVSNVIGHSDCWLYHFWDKQIKVWRHIYLCQIDNAKRVFLFMLDSE